MPKIRKTYVLSKRSQSELFESVEKALQANLEKDITHSIAFVAFPSKAEFVLKSKVFSGTILCRDTQIELSMDVSLLGLALVPRIESWIDNFVAALNDKDSQ